MRAPLMPRWARAMRDHPTHIREHGFHRPLRWPGYTCFVLSALFLVVAAFFWHH